MKIQFNYVENHDNHEMEHIPSHTQTKQKSALSIREMITKQENGQPFAVSQHQTYDSTPSEITNRHAVDLTDVGKVQQRYKSLQLELHLQNEALNAKNRAAEIEHQKSAMRAEIMAEMASEKTGV